MRHHGRTISLFQLTLSTVLVFAGAGLTARADTHAGNIAVANGDVRISSSADDKGRPAKPNEPVNNNEIVKTGNGASAKVLFTDQSIMDLGPNSALKVSDYAVKDVDNRTATFSLMYGKLRALVTKKVGDSGNVKVKSADAVMGVRGTEFVVDRSSPGAGTQLVVVSGAVAVSPPAGGPPVMIGAGQMVTATPQFAQSGASNGGGSGAGEKSGGSSKSGSSSANGSALEVKQASSEQIAAAVGGAKAADNTLVAALKIDTSGTSGSSTTSAPKIEIVINPVPPPPPPPPPLPPPPPPPPPAGNPVQLTVSIQ